MTQGKVNSISVLVCDCDLENPLASGDCREGRPCKVVGLWKDSSESRLDMFRGLSRKRFRNVHGIYSQSLGNY